MSSKKKSHKKKYHKTRPQEPKWKVKKTGEILGLVSALLAIASSLGAASIGQENKSSVTISCPSEISDAIRLQKENPHMNFNFSGELEKQCKLNEVLNQITGSGGGSSGNFPEIEKIPEP